MPPPQPLSSRLQARSSSSYRSNINRCRQDDLAFIWASTQSLIKHRRRRLSSRYFDRSVCMPSKASSTLLQPTLVHGLPTQLSSPPAKHQHLVDMFASVATTLAVVFRLVDQDVIFYIRNLANIENGERGHVACFYRPSDRAHRRTRSG
jgi:hypothetical protein